MMSPEYAAEKERVKEETRLRALGRLVPKPSGWRPAVTSKYGPHVGAKQCAKAVKREVLNDDDSPRVLVGGRKVCDL